MFDFSSISILIAFHGVISHTPSISPDGENAFFSVPLGCLYGLNLLRVVRLAGRGREGPHGSCTECIVGEVSQQEYGYNEILMS